MDIVKNEAGYALITVLLIITIFMIIFLSFTGQYMGSVKQNQVVEKSSQSVAIAEMGMSYYQAAVKNAYITRQVFYNDGFSNGNNVYTVKQITDDITNSINTELRKGLLKTNVDGPDNYFKVNEQDDNTFAENVNNKIIINFSITGTKGTKNTILTTDMYIDLQGITFTSGVVIPEIQAVNKIEKPDSNFSTLCIDPPVNYSFKKGDCPSGILITKPNIGYTDNFQKYDGTIYATDLATGTLNMDGVGNKSKLKIHGDNLRLDGNLINVTNVKIESKHNVTLGGHFTADTSNLFVGGNIVATGKFELSDNSDKMYYTLVRGNLTVPTNHNLLIGSNNTVCVNGTLSAGIATIRGTLYINRGQDNFSTSNTSNIKYVSDVPQSELTAKCGNTFDKKSIDWGEDARTIIERIVYQ